EFVQKPAMDERIVSLEATDSRRTLRALRLKEIGAKPITVSFKVVQQRAAGSIAIGPFAVIGATSQQGTIVLSAPTEIRFRFMPAYASERELTEEERRREPSAVAGFRYYHIPDIDKLAKDPSPSIAAPLQVEVETIRGEVEAKVTHALRLVQSPQSERPR